ncbi:hypothetical protein EG329_005667 [Mollisiaceae sp. DMI_Dod_QoI]|nr:hypothetical protein EG329_005667 [Helotiales sp. DMI_Dod_QoI]
MSFADDSTANGSGTRNSSSSSGSPVETEVKICAERDLEAGLEDTRDGRKEKVDAAKDPNKVGWEGPDDPNNPMNWPHWQKMTQVVLVSVMTMMTSLATTMFAPGVAQLMEDFNCTNSNLGAFTVSVYVLGFAVAPLVIAPLSETYGRLVLYLEACLLFIIFTMACALSKNMAMFIVFRLLAGCAGSAPLALGGGTIADLIPQEERGGAMAMFAIGPLLGPVIGPIIGGFITEYVGWRWVFWVLTIAMGVVAIVFLILMRETYGVVILKRKAAKLRKSTGNPLLSSINDTGRDPRVLLRIAIVRPVKMLAFQPIVLLMSIYTAVVFGYMFLLFTTFSAVFEEQYHFSESVIGLSYLGLGIGMFIGLIGFSKLSDRTLKRRAKEGDGEMKPEYRLPLMMYSSPVLPIGFFLYGWSAQAHTHWIVPIIGTGIIGVGIICIFLAVQTYLVDSFPTYAASVLSANTVLRCIVGAILPLAGDSMYATLGLGWGNSLLAFIALAFIPVPWLFYQYGEQLRKRNQREL